MTSNYQALAGMFSADSFRGLSQPTAAADIRAILDSAKVPGLGRRMRLRTIFDKAYEHLLQNYRCEYVYKNSLTNDLLLKRHDLNNGPTSARLLTEFWVGDVRADLVVINGTSTAYEVKTSLDTLSRLPKQIANYSKCFDKIYVVTSAAMLTSVEATIPDHVGILVMNELGELVEMKPSLSNKENIDLHMVFRSMRELEVLEICREISGLPLDSPNVLRAEACWEVFRQLKPTEAHEAMVSITRRRRIHPSQQQLIQTAPESMKHLCIGKTMAANQYRAISGQLEILV